MHGIDKGRGGGAVGIPDPNQTLEQKEMAAKQERVAIHQMTLQKVTVANQFLALPEAARTPASTASANKFLEDYFATPINLGATETNGFAT